VINSDKYASFITLFKFQGQGLSQGFAVTARLNVIGHFKNEQFHAETGAPHWEEGAIIVDLLGNPDQMTACIAITISLIEPGCTTWQQYTV